MTPEEHRKRAEELLGLAEEVATDLKAVPPEGVVRHIEHITPSTKGGRVIRKTQSERRDELGKYLMGIYAEAQVHATLYAADTAWLAGDNTRTRSGREPWRPQPINFHAGEPKHD